MKEVSNILQNSPFMLSPKDSNMLSRYIIEDSPNDFVYEDENNEIHRNIAKSIIKHVVGEYHLPHIEVIEEEWKKVASIYKGNITAALKTIAPKGIITVDKFLELITGLGIECSDELKDWLVGAMVVKSQSL